MSNIEISLKEAKQKLEKKEAIFLDIRREEDFKTRHIPGAKHISKEKLADFAKTADKTKTYVVYCYRGFSSQDGTKLLLENGFKKVFSMKGGFEGWKESEL